MPRRIKISDLVLLAIDSFTEATDVAMPANSIEGIPIPKTYKEAVSDPVYGDKWKEAVRAELETLIQFGTWETRARKDIQGNVASTKWVFNVKIGADGRMERFKARLVARGFTQLEGMDFKQTFAPVFRLDSLRVLFAVAAMFNMIAHLLDATNAFVGSPLDIPNYIDIPEGLEEFEKRAIPRKLLVLELKQSLYGLRQAANLWNRKLSGFITGELGFKGSSADDSVFINNQGVIIALYVDDIVIFAKNPDDIAIIKAKLQSFHPMKDAELVNKILGIRVSWNRNNVTLDQEVYTRQILEEFGMSESKAVGTAASPHMNLDDGEESKLDRKGQQLFRRIIARCMFLASGTRPDISFATGRLSQYLASPTGAHLSAAKHLLRYLRGKMQVKISYHSGRAHNTNMSLLWIRGCCIRERPRISINEWKCFSF